MRTKTIFQLMIAALAGAIIMALFMLYSGIVQISGAGAVERGNEMAQLLCQRCHAIGLSGKSPNPLSPPFRTLQAKLTMEGLADEIDEGLLLGHRPMPPWQFSARQAEDLLAYIASLDK